MKHRMKDHVD